MADYKKYKVGITAKENWASDISFEQLDYTLWSVNDGGDGCGYIALKDNIGVLPNSDVTTWRKATEAGQSIYDLAVKYHHFVGTEEEFEAQYQQALSDAISAAQSASVIDTQVRVAEQQRVVAEQERVSAESQRASAEESRVSYEAQRSVNETGRVNAEDSRVAAENARVVAENQRASAESTRATNEENRRAEFGGMMRDAETAIGLIDAAMTEAENVDATVDGMIVTITDRHGVSKSVNIGFDIYRTYGSVAAMNADAANVENGKFVMIATLDPTSTENAQLWVRNSNAATSQNPFTFISDLDQASSAAWADWMENQKPIIEADHTTAVADHTQAVSDNTNATNDHAVAGQDHTTAGTDHTQAVSDSTRAGQDHSVSEQDHTRAEGDHTTASTDHSTAQSDHTTAETDHTTASSDHTIASGDHTKALSDHDIASGDHTTAGTDHATAVNDHASVEVYVDSLGAFDLSKYNAVGGVLATYADLSAALTSLNALDSQYKYGGMSFKFVRTSDHNYVQFRYMPDDATTVSKFTNIANWQGVETDVTPNSKNLVESGSVYDFKDVFSIMSKTNNIDLCFIDKNQNCLVYFKDGHIITKNFDSSKAIISDETNLSFNFSIQDENGNVALLVKDGHVITQNFDSRGIAPIIGAVENNGFYINEWSGKNICFLGDSIIDNNFVCNVIKDTLRCNIYNRGWSGSMITPTEYLQGSQEGVVLTNKAYAFTNRCDYTDDNNPDNHHGAMPSADLIDLVVIHGGGNDYGHGNQTSRTVIGVGGIDGAMGNDLTYLPEGETDPTATVGSTFEAALKYTCYKVRQKYPNIPVAICTIFRSYDYINGNSFVSSHTEYVVNSDMSLTPNVRTYRDGVKNKDDFNNIIRSVARQFGMFIIDFDLFGMPSYNEYFGDLYYVHKESTGHGDLTHPSENYGAWNYGKFMAKEIMRIPYMDKSKVEDDSRDFPDNPEDD